MTAQFSRFVLLVMVAAVTATWGVCTVGVAVNPAALTATLVMTAFGLLAQLLVFELPRGAAGSIAFIPFLALALVSPSWMAIAAVAGSSLITETLIRRAPLKALFNIAQTSFALALAILSYDVLGGQPLGELSGLSLLESTRLAGVPFIALFAVFFAVNWLAVSGAVAAMQQRPIVQVWKENALATLLYDIISSPVVYFLAWFYVKFGVLGAAGLAVPLVGVRQLYRTLLQLEQVNQELLQLMVKAIEARDPYTSGHSIRVAHYSKIIARAIGLSAREVNRVGTAALLHDVGKIHEAYAPILQKPGKLTPEEWAIMQTHPIRSAELVATVSHLRDLVSAVRHHHENWDGSGYPDGIAGEQIPLESRIIMFADTIDAMTTDRPYRKALGEAEVRAELIKHSGRQFDPSICDRLTSSSLFGELFAPRSPEFTPDSSPAVAA